MHQCVFDYKLQRQEVFEQNISKRIQLTVTLQNQSFHVIFLALT